MAQFRYDFRSLPDNIGAPPSGWAPRNVTVCPDAAGVPPRPSAHGWGSVGGFLYHTRVECWNETAGQWEFVTDDFDIDWAGVTYVNDIEVLAFVQINPSHSGTVMFHVGDVRVMVASARYNDIRIYLDGINIGWTPGGGGTSNFGTKKNTYHYDLAEFWYIRVQVNKTTPVMRVKAWPRGMEEPTSWDASRSTEINLVGSGVGARCENNKAGTALRYIAVGTDGDSAEWPHSDFAVPATPTLTADALRTDGTVEFAGSAISGVPSADHASSWWEVTDSLDAGFAAPIVKTGWDPNHLTSFKAYTLPPGSYIARVKYRTFWEQESSFSLSVPFTVAGRTSVEIGGVPETYVPQGELLQIQDQTGDHAWGMPPSGAVTFGGSTGNAIRFTAFSPDIGRWVNVNRVAGESADWPDDLGSPGYVYLEKDTSGFNIRAMLEKARPVTAARFTIVDRVRVARKNTFSFFRAIWGIHCQNMSSYAAGGTETALIGFRATHNDNFWHIRVTSHTAAVLLDTVTPFTYEEFRRLRVTIDGEEKKVYFYIDENLVGTYEFDAGYAFSNSVWTRHGYNSGVAAYTNFLGWVQIETASTVALRMYQETLL